MVTVVLTATAMALTLRGMLFVPRFPLPLCVLMYLCSTYVRMLEFADERPGDMPVVEESPADGDDEEDVGVNQAAPLPWCVARCRRRG